MVLVGVLSESSIRLLMLDGHRRIRVQNVWNLQSFAVLHQLYRRSVVRNHNGTHAYSSVIPNKVFLWNSAELPSDLLYQ